MSAQVPSHLQGTRADTKLRIPMRSFVFAQVTSPLQGTRADTKLQMPMVIFERPVLSLCNPRKCCFSSTVHNDNRSNACPLPTHYT